jgi:hypothetical protein
MAMGYYEELSEGSKIHKVRQAYKRRIKKGIQIMPADDSDECIAAFSGHREARNQALL